MDTLLAIDTGDLFALVLLDMSAAFHTVDYGILFRRLQISYAVLTSAITAVRLPFDCNSTAQRRFYVTAYLFWAAELRPK